MKPYEAGNAKKRWTATDLVTPQVVLPGLVLSVVIFALLTGVLG